MADFGNSNTVQPYMSALDQCVGSRAVLYKAGVDQPFVEALRQLSFPSSAPSELQVLRRENWGPSAFQGAVGAQQAFRGAQI